MADWARAKDPQANISHRQNLGKVDIFQSSPLQMPHAYKIVQLN